jgi:hypothetical protein
MITDGVGGEYDTVREFEIQAPIFSPGNYVRITRVFLEIFPEARKAKLRMIAAATTNRIYPTRKEAPGVRLEVFDEEGARIAYQTDIGDLIITDCRAYPRFEFNVLQDLSRDELNRIRSAKVTLSGTNNSKGCTTPSRR